MTAHHGDAAHHDGADHCVDDFLVDAVHHDADDFPDDIVHHCDAGFLHDDAQQAFYKDNSCELLSSLYNSLFLIHLH
ncbi:hypothetical protein BABA_06561 [Neobacillus bataviensis LMG 21833]|uniref:Uncharacterized protein n=1 Tax=Neobacillus bataviensis LMG 21833 TaxID=1117379 RepID=K6DPC3_9BACI|nr:hypothetical protein BABA_06561 [Neobacillus bataviensis LMG 21833]